ncbi:flagellar biosynthesis protein FlhF [Gallaecimonas pentaromativorans]|uniref:flagellar biosynthesis protein FlhF n=1 Tax=Gallaecimonas pentaromativorans TaxID=584787 RepID=UPI00067F4892|nr:flagellar biosynthesis protein FlhF [Gallaecimonas pentaromativorans]MED5526674.1 flagellar biosynthesis protein FlhF [Pseudomonadota bacterium]
MKIHRFFAKDMRSALAEVKDTLGVDAVILSNTKVNGGVEIVAAVDVADKTPQGRASAGRAGERELPEDRVTLSSAPRQAAPRQTAKAEPRKKAAPTLNWDWQSREQDSRSESLPEWSRGLARQAMEQQPEFAAAAEPASPVKKVTMADLSEEMLSLRQLLEHQLSGLRQDAKARRQPVRTLLEERLVKMGFPSTLAEEVTAPMPEALGANDGWKWLRVQLKKRLFTSDNTILRKGGVVAMMGPTGVGKTTTVAKLAAHYALKHGADEVALVSTDTYRIGAHEQLATYGRIIGCPVKVAKDAEELEDVLYQLRNRSLVLIDTAGMGQRDLRLNQQLSTLVQAGQVPIQRYLVLSATAQQRVLEDALNRFSQVPLDGLVLTKLDETLSLGEVLGLAIQNALPIGYLTDGQRVPEDLQVAQAENLLERALALFVGTAAA